MSTTTSFNCGAGYTNFSSANTITCGGVGPGATVKGRIRDKDNGTTEYVSTVPALGQFAMNVATSGGDGTGSVSSQPAGIACPADCTETYQQGSVVTLTATTSPTTRFVGWRGACVGTSPVCTLTMDSAKSTTAVFGDVPVANLTVEVFDSLDGSVSGDGGSFACSTLSCSASFALGTVIHLTAVPGAGATFISWGGACVVDDALPLVCTVTLDASKSVSAQFSGPNS